MGIQFNSPNRKSIRWDNVSIFSDGMINRVNDGYTDKKYVYWDKNSPTEFKTTNILPLTRDELVFINIDGIGSKYASERIIIDNIFTSDEKDTLFKHIQNTNIHSSLEEKNKIDKITSNITDLVEKINLLTEKNEQLIKELNDVKSNYTEVNDKLKEIEKRLDSLKV